MQEDASKRPAVRQRTNRTEEKGRMAKRRKEGPLTGVSQVAVVCTVGQRHCCALSVVTVLGTHAVDVDLSHALQVAMIECSCFHLPFIAENVWSVPGCVQMEYSERCQHQHRGREWFKKDQTMHVSLI